MVGDVRSRVSRAYRGGDGRGRDLERDLYRPRISIARTIRLLDLFGRLIAPTIGNRWFTYYFETILLR